MLPESLTTLLLPAAIDQSDMLVLLFTSFATALMTATLGIGGGLLLLAISASILPPLALIPIHGMVQAAANGNRALMTHKHLNRPVFGYFVMGACIGAALASLVVVQLPADTILICVGLFILFLTWGPRLKLTALRPLPIATTSAITTLISMFVGASGPLVAAFTQQLSGDRFERIATFSACMSVQHGLKLLVFGWLGFAYSEWLALIAGMIVTGVAGTWVGLNLLARISNKHFDQAFRIMITLLALKLLYSAIVPM